MRSSTTRSIECSSNCLSASSPSRACTTRWPSRSREYAKSFWTASSSSTRRMVAGFDMSRGKTATYYSRAISDLTPPTGVKRRPRSGSLDRPVNGRLYRVSWIVLAVPLLAAAFTISRPAPLPQSPSALEPTFDNAAAYRLAQELAALYPTARRAPPRRQARRGGWSRSSRASACARESSDFQRRSPAAVRSISGTSPPWSPAVRGTPSSSSHTVTRPEATPA